MSLLQRLSLRFILELDAIVCAVFTLVLLAGAGLLDSLFDLPTTFLRLVGVGLIPWVMLVTIVAIRLSHNRLAVQGIIAGNVLWVAGSVALLIGDWGTPNGLGVAFLIVQALAVAAFAIAQSAKLGR